MVFSTETQRLNGISIDYIIDIEQVYEYEGSQAEISISQHLTFSTPLKKREHSQVLGGATLKHGSSTCWIPSGLYFFHTGGSWIKYRLSKTMHISLCQQEQVSALAEKRCNTVHHTYCVVYKDKTQKNCSSGYWTRFQKKYCYF